jgi:DNA uptake protein ComE-like DNA-binding protein
MFWHVLCSQGFVTAHMEAPMRTREILSLLIVAGLATFATGTLAAQEVAKRTAKRAAKEATESAARDAAEDAAKKAVKKAVAPDAIDLNAATPEQLAKLGFDEATAKKIADARPFSSLEDAKIKEAIPADVLKKLEGKITVKPPAK